MRRKLFDSIASRTGGLLVAGLLLTITATLAVFMSDSLQGSSWNQTARALERLALIASLADRIAAPARVALAETVSDPDLSVAWRSGQGPPRMERDFATQHLARDLAVAARPYGLDRIDAGHAPNHRFTGASVAAAERGALQVWIQLSDGSWLAIFIRSETVGALATGRLLIALAVLAIGASTLAVWASRRLTAPLARFAEAAERLGTDVQSAPMAESGPSEIRRAAGAFNRMQDRIRRFVEDRTLMLAAVSHDLRTLLTRLELRIEAIDDPRQREKAASELREMEAMLGASIAFARDETDAEPTTPLDLALLLQSLCDDLTDAGHAAAYQGPAHLTCRARPTGLRRVFTNLLDNALAYGGEAELAVAVRGEAIEVTVADRGPGIAPELRERVFAPFFRCGAPRSRQTIGGTGLGLTVARSIVRRHGGEVVLEDRPGGGLCVRVALPRLETNAGTHRPCA